MIRKYFRLRRRLVVGLALAALTAVPVAQATTNRSAPHDPALESALTSNGSQGIEVVSENGQTQATADAYREPTLITTENSYGASEPSPTQAPVLAVSSPGGFDWADAGIGASIGFGAVLVLLASVVVGRRTRSRFDQTGLTSA